MRKMVLGICIFNNGRYMKNSMYTLFFLLVLATLSLYPSQPSHIKALVRAKEVNTGLTIMMAAIIDDNPGVALTCLAAGANIREICPDGKTMYSKILARINDQHASQELREKYIFLKLAFDAKGAQAFEKEIEEKRKKIVAQLNATRFSKKDLQPSQASNARNQVISNSESAGKVKKTKKIVAQASSTEQAEVKASQCAEVKERETHKKSQDQQKTQKNDETRKKLEALRKVLEGKRKRAMKSAFEKMRYVGALKPNPRDLLIRMQALLNANDLYLKMKNKLSKKIPDTTINNLKDAILRVIKYYVDIGLKNSHDIEQVMQEVVLDRSLFDLMNASYKRCKKFDKSKGANLTEYIDCMIKVFGCCNPSAESEKALKLCDALRANDQNSFDELLDECVLSPWLDIVHECARVNGRFEFLTKFECALQQKKLLAVK
jgi:hypothetical protein